MKNYIFIICGYMILVRGYNEVEITRCVVSVFIISKEDQS